MPWLTDRNLLENLRIFNIFNLADESANFLMATRPPSARKSTCWLQASVLLANWPAVNRRRMQFGICNSEFTEFAGFEALKPVAAKKWTIKLPGKWSIQCKVQLLNFSGRFSRRFSGRFKEIKADDQNTITKRNLELFSFSGGYMAVRHCSAKCIEGRSPKFGLWSVQDNGGEMPELNTEHFGTLSAPANPTVRSFEWMVR